MTPMTPETRELGKLRAQNRERQEQIESLSAELVKLRKDREDREDRICLARRWMVTLRFTDGRSLTTPALGTPDSITYYYHKGGPLNIGNDTDDLVTIKSIELALAS